MVLLQPPVWSLNRIAQCHSHLRLCLDPAVKLYQFPGNLHRLSLDREFRPHLVCVPPFWPAEEKWLVIHHHHHHLSITITTPLFPSPSPPPIPSPSPPPIHHHHHPLFHHHHHPTISITITTPYPSPSLPTIPSPSPPSHYSITIPTPLFLT